MADKTDFSGTPPPTPPKGQTLSSNVPSNSGDYGPFSLQNFQKDYQAAAKRGAILDTSLTPEGDNYWLDPQRVVRYREFLRAQPPDYQAPDWMQKDQLEAAYQYLKFKNNDSSWMDWKPLDPNDPGVSFLKSIPVPPVQHQPTWDQVWQPPTKQDLVDQQNQADIKAFGDWNNLTPAEQLYVGAFMSQAGLKNRPDWTRYTAALGQGALAIPGGAAIGALIGGGPIGAAIGGGLAGIGTAYQALTGTKVPILGDLLNVFNLPAQGLEHLIGVTGQAADQGLPKILENLPAAWQAANLTYETQQQDLLNLYAKITNPVVGALGGRQMEIAGPGEIWQISQGIATPQPLTGPRGVAALNEARARIESGDDPLQVYQDFTSKFGDSGTFNDFIMQTVLDPTLFAEHVGGKIGEGGARLLGQERFAQALGEGAGSALISALPMGARGLVEKATGLHGPEGLIRSIEKYRGWIQTDHFPVGTDRVPAARLSDFEKWAGGLDSEGRIKNVQPTVEGSNPVSRFVNYLNQLTPETKADAILNMAQDNLAMTFERANGNPDKMVSDLHMSARQDPAEIAREGTSIIGSPVTATIAQSLRDVLASGWDQEMLLRWHESEGKRNILETVAANLKKTTGEVLEAYQNNPDRLLEEIKAAGGPVGDVAALKDAFDVFTGDSALPWDARQFQAQLTVSIYDKMGQALATRYNLKPDAAIFRAAQTLKAAQSLLLLGFNPAYFVNNQVNNMVTRAATGVFGYMTPRQINTFLERFGVTPERLKQSVDVANQEVNHGPSAIHAAKQANDAIAQAHKTITTVNKKLGLFSAFSNMGEKLESSNAYVIGMLQFMGKGWKVDKGLHRMRPEVETYLDRHAPGVKEAIYRAAESGLNMREVESKIYGQAIRPEVDAVINDAARTLFPDSPDAGVTLLKGTGIQARLEHLLEGTTTPQEASAVFTKVQSEIQAIVDEAHKREITTRAQDVTNQIQGEGHAAVPGLLTGTIDRIARAGTDAARYQRASDYITQTFAGMVRALGTDTKENTSLLKEITQAQRAFTRMDKARRKMIAELKTATPERARELRVQLEEQARAYAEQTRATIEKVNKRSAVQAKTKPGAKPDTGAPVITEEMIRGLVEKGYKPGDIKSLTPEQAAAILRGDTMPEATPVPPPTADPRTRELNRLAVEYGLVDANGMPVMTYLMNVINRAQPKGQKFADPSLVPLDIAEAALAAHKEKFDSAAAVAARELKLSAEDIIKQADTQAREAEIQANGMLTRRMVREQMQQVFSAGDAEAEAAMILMDLHADRVARAQGHTPTDATRDAWYATHIAGVVQGSDPVTSYNNYYQEGYGDLMAVHNLRAADLIDADKLGGLPVPSVAVMQAGRALDSYGDITLIGRRSLIDPQANPANRVFDADIYSPTRPIQVWQRVPSKVAQALVKRFTATDNEIGDYFTSELWDKLEGNVPDRNEAVKLFDRRPAPKLQFLREHGIDLPISYEPHRLHYGFSERPEFQAWMKEHYTELNDLIKRSSGTGYEGTEVYQAMESKMQEALLAGYAERHSPEDAARLARTEWKNLTGPDGHLSFNGFDNVLRDVINLSKPRQVDLWDLDSAAARAITSNRLTKEYETWAKAAIDGVFAEPRLRLRGKLVPYTLENIVAAMTGLPIRNGENTMTFDHGPARAAAAREFKNVEQMHKAEGQLATSREVQTAKEIAGQTITMYQNELTTYAEYKGSSWDAMDSSMRALSDYLKGGKNRSPERMTRALEKNGFSNLDDTITSRALDAAEALGDTPTIYFEAKPQRAVQFNEFAGAVIPIDAPQEVRDVLERRGIQYETYSGPEDRPEAIAKFYNKDGVLFQSATESRKQIAEIIDRGYIDLDTLREVFKDPVTGQYTTPAYLRGIVRFILQQRDKYNRGEMTPRDVAKAYLITVSSQGASEQPVTTVLEGMRKAGVRFERNGEPIDMKQYTVRVGINKKLRPEDITGVWLTTDQGKRALDALERDGTISPEWLTFLKGRHVYGRFGNAAGTDPGMWFITPGARHKLNAAGEHAPTSRYNLADIHEITKRINEAKGDATKIGEVVRSLAGIGDGKAGFIKHMLGFADEMTVDVQEANFWKELVPAEYKAVFGREDYGKVAPEIKDMVQNVFAQLRSEGIGTDIPPEMYNHVLHHWIWDYQKGQENHHLGLIEGQQLGQGPKGGVRFLQDGRAVIRALDAPDVSTIVHEIGHVFRRDLSAADLDTVAQLGGLPNGAALTDLEQRFQRGEILQGDPEYDAYVQAEENFARGWERYLAEGDAPTPELKSVFSKFTDWMLQIYSRLRGSLDQFGRRRVIGFDKQSEFNVSGTSTVDIRATVNGKNLRDIFDRLLVENRTGDTPAPTSTEPLPPAPGRSPQEINIIEQPVKKLPEQVQAAIKDVAQQLINELAPSRIILQSKQDIEGGAEVTKYSRQWEGPRWWKEILDTEKAAGSVSEDLKSQYMGQLKSIVSGRDTGKARVSQAVKELILQRAMGQADIESNMQPAVLRYMGDNETLFRAYGNQILNSEEPALRAMFGDEWSQVVDDYLVWMTDQEASGNPPEINTGDATDIEGNPVPEGELYQGKKKAAQAVPPVDLFGNPTEKPFTLEQQQAQDQTFKPQEQAQQGELFNRAEQLRTIEAKQAGESAAPQGTEDQPSLFQRQSPSAWAEANAQPAEEVAAAGQLRAVKYITENGNYLTGDTHQTTAARYYAGTGPLDNIISRFVNDAGVVRVIWYGPLNGKLGVQAARITPEQALRIRELAGGRPVTYDQIDSRGRLAGGGEDVSVNEAISQLSNPPEGPTLFQNAKPEGTGVPVGGTPVNEPYGSTLDEITGEKVMPLLDAVKANYLKALADKPLKFDGLDSQAQGAIKDYMKTVENDMASTKYAAMRYGEQMRDSALLNYSRRYGFDQMLELAFPYQFWYTRSMLEWAKRMVDKPGWYAMYARMQQAQAKTAANMPDRLRGKMRLPAPWLPDWAGGAVWFDPMSKLLPFTSFGQPLEQYTQNVDDLTSAAEYSLKGLVSSDQITQSEADQAKATHKGKAWDLAMAQASADQNKDTSPSSMVGLMMSPSFFWDAGNKILQGRANEISPLPLTRTASAYQTALQGTPLEGAGNVIGLAAQPEKLIRKNAGLSEFGQWGDYYINRELANMAADGTIDASTARIAMIEKSGPAYDQAYQRVRYEQMTNVPGAAAISQAAHGAVVGTLEALPTAIFGGTLFPTGELKMRGLADEFKAAYKAKDRGDSQALNNFFAEHPEYEARLALNTPPEEQLKQFLISELWNRYSALERPNRKVASDALGQDFKDAFLNKETRSYDSINVDTLARWNQMLGGAVPKTKDTAAAVANPATPPDLYSPELAGKITSYQDERSQKYPNYYALQSTYFNIPETDKAARKAFLARFPQLPKYWEWNKQYKADHPDMSQYWNANSTNTPPLSSKELAAIDPVLMRQVMAWSVAGQALTSGAQSELRRLSSTKGVTPEQYAHMILQSYVATGQ